MRRNSFLSTRNRRTCHYLAGKMKIARVLVSPRSPLPVPRLSELPPPGAAAHRLYNNKFQLPQRGSYRGANGAMISRARCRYNRLYKPEFLPRVRPRAIVGGRSILIRSLIRTSVGINWNVNEFLRNYLSSKAQTLRRDRSCSFPSVFHNDVSA